MDTMVFRGAVGGCGALALALLGGCSADVGVSVDGGSAGSDLTDSVSKATAPYLVLDLASGTTATRAAVPDLATNSAYRTTSMVFHRLTGASGEHWLGVFEVTQAQWQAIAGSTPWVGTAPAIVGSAAIGDQLPAFNLSYAAITAALGAYRAAHGPVLGVPDDATWTEACAAGGTATWSWGEAHDRATLLAHAAVWETQGATVGPRAVGGREPNAYGFFDLHGNVWEWTSPGTRVRGGSWHDPAIAARTSLLADPLVSDLSGDTVNALIGVRLILQP